jgi:hypothetical protein
MKPDSAILVFEPVGHTYRLSGELVPSVTTILSDMGCIPWYPDKAFFKNRGQAVHDACALLVRDKLDLAATDKRLHGYIESFRKFKVRTGFHVEHIELPVWSVAYRVAGRLDYVGLLDGRRSVVDLKSGEPADAAALQTAAYTALAKESHGVTATRRLTLRLDPDGGDPKPEEYQDLAYDIQVFFSLSTGWHWRKRHGLIK